jgi:DNA-binding NarL/FixJ family response regulator
VAVATGSVADLVRAGREALTAADWDAARACFEQAEALGETAEVLDGLGDVAHFQGEYERALELKERAFAVYRRADMRVEAADTARWLAFMYATLHGSFAAAGGWMTRAAGLLEGVEECAAHGWLALDRAPLSRDTSEREKAAVSALAIARRFDDTDLEFEALALLGETRVASGRFAEGMTLLDQAMAAVCAGEVVGHAAVGEIYCRLLSACEHALDLRRAEEWMSLIDRHVVWQHFVRPTCRTHYGGILVALGQWSQAEVELLDAIDVFQRGYRGDGVFPLVRLADLRVRQGRFEEAERLLDGVDWHPIARRATATIALGRGELGLAEDLTRLCFDDASPTDPACAPLLELLVRIELARGDPAGAEQTRDRLIALAAESDDDRVGACAELARGLVMAAAGEERAAFHLRQALETFSALQLPLEASRAQLELARALAARAPDAAIAEAKLARTKFERLGAAPDADAAAALLRHLGVTGRASSKHRGPLTKREMEVLSLLGAGLSNAEIAARLFISRRTAEHHVASILSKLDLRSRAEAAAFAVRETQRPVGE